MDDTEILENLNKLRELYPAGNYWDTPEGREFRPVWEDWDTANEAELDRIELDRDDRITANNYGPEDPWAAGDPFADDKGD